MITSQYRMFWYDHTDEEDKVVNFTMEGKSLAEADMWAFDWCYSHTDKHYYKLYRWVDAQKTTAGGYWHYVGDLYHDHN